MNESKEEVSSAGALWKRRILFLGKIGFVAGVLLTGILLFVFREHIGEARALTGSAVEWVLDYVRAAGAAVFFSAMAVLPSFGFPLSVFSVAAAPAFAGEIGLFWVFFLCGAALGISLVISYVSSRYLMRPWVERLIVWLGYKLPEVSRDNHGVVIFLVQVTPGVPFVLKGLFLGLMAVPFRLYLLISWAITYAYICIFILFADSLAQGKGLRVIGAVSAFLALGTALHLFRKRMAKRAEADVRGEE